MQIQVDVQRRSADSGQICFYERRDESRNGKAARSFNDTDGVAQRLEIDRVPGQHQALLRGHKAVR